MLTPPDNYSNPAAANRPSDVAGRPSRARWLTILSDRPTSYLSGFNYTLVAGGENSSRSLFCAYESDSEVPSHASRDNCAVVFGGTLYNRDDLAEQLAELPTLSLDENVADLILEGYLRWGIDVLPRLRGPFALVIWDSIRNVLFGVRDPLGSHPLFYSEAPNVVFVSPATDVLTRQPNVSRDLNRVTMAHLLMQRALGWQDTFFEAVRRIPAGHAMVFERNQVRPKRYWDPAPGGEVNWTRREEVERFDEVFDRAVGRCLSFGSTGIFLSGGLDSVSVAAAAIDLSRKERRQPPLALSLVFPHDETNEEQIQRSVAAQLGLPQVIKPFFEATGENGLLRPALAMNPNLTAPILNPWLPAYAGLAREGMQRGCNAIVTGSGGDDWLGVGPLLAADLIRALDFYGLYRLWQSMRLSYTISGFALARSLVWKYGAKPLLLPTPHRLVKRFAPWALKLRHRASRPNWVPPKWVAPDPALRRQLQEHAEQTNGNATHASQGSHYVQAGKKALDHPMVSWEQEEMFEVYRRMGVRVLHPFWDADLVDVLFRMPPDVLNQGNRSKGLVRDSLARRFPTLGFERQKKVLAVNFYRLLIQQDAPGIWQEIGGAKALKELGIIDEHALDQTITRKMNHPSDARDAHEAWTVLNLESWTRTQVA
jgi:asparagine synthetase B (glutamine-hydrolysing)